MTDLQLTVLRDRYVPSPESENAHLGLPADGVMAVPFDFAMACDWPTDAHCVQYENVCVDGLDIRLASEALDEFPVKMLWLIGDVDGPDHNAPQEWRDAIEPLLDMTGLAWYPTKGGYRVIAQLREPVVLDGMTDAERWKAIYLAWCDELEEFGVSLDRSGKDWTRLFRLPRVMRDGEPTDGELRGETPVIDTPVPPLPLPPEARDAPKPGVQPAPAGPHSDPNREYESAVDRAITKAQLAMPSIEGQGGDHALFVAANELASILDSEEDVHAVLEAVFNPRCEPPWPDSKLKREARVAIRRREELGGVGAWAKRRQRREEEFQRGFAELQAKAQSGVEAGIPAEHPIEDLPLLTDMKGRPLPTVDNILIALGSWFGADLWLDEMTGRTNCDRARDMIDCADGRWSDVHTTALRAALQRVGVRVSRPDVQDAVSLHAKRNQRNPLAELLAEMSEQWDGVARVDTALTRYWGCDDSPAVRASSRVSLLSLVARGMCPGAKVDTCLVLIGEEGKGKSTSLRHLAIHDEWFGDSELPLGDKDARQLIRGKWVWEMQEMASMRKREAEQVKAFISQSYDTYRASYGRESDDVKRTCVLFGTANRTDILQDPTGNRRYLPVVTRNIDTDALLRDRDQIIAEAAARVLAGEQHHPTHVEAAVLKKAVREFEAADPWEELVTAWLGAKPGRDGEGFMTSELFSFAGGAVPIESGRQSPRDASRMAGVLQRLGFERRRARRRGKRSWYWLPVGSNGSTVPDEPKLDLKQLN